MERETVLGSAVSRRRVLSTGALTALAVALFPGGVMAGPEEVAKVVAAFTGGGTAEEGKVSIDLPEIAENGNTVPLKVAVDSPMSASDHVTDIVVIAEGNPIPQVVTFHLTPMSGKSNAEVRMRLAGTQHVAVLAKTSGGQLYMSKKEIKVTIGGCGG